MKRLRTRNPGGSSERKEPKCLKVLKKQALEFCRETGLHGYKYIGQIRRSKTERIIWAIAIFTSMCCSIVLMKLAWDYYAAHPTLTVIESTHHGIWNYPFPAVTLCNINRVSLNLARTFVERLKLPPNVTREHVVEELRLLNELIEPGAFEYDVRENLSRLQDIFDSNDVSISTVVESVTMDCKELVEDCRWKGDYVDCTLLFKKSLSRDGICCSFNYITFEDVTREPTIVPKRVTACGYQTGLTILVNPEPQNYHAAILGSVGVKVIMHSPFDYPDYNAANKLMPLNSQVFLTIEPEEIYSTYKVKNLAIETRNCIFHDEGDRIFKRDLLQQNFTWGRYSYQNCMAQCRCTVIKEKCGCIPYYYPQNVTRICNLKDVECLFKYKLWYDTSWPGVNLTLDNVERTERDFSKRPCNCLPDCSFYRYTVESSRGNLDPNVYYNDLTYSRLPSDGVDIENRSVVHVFFGDLVSTQYRRNVYYNWHNLFASFGGLLGLLAGFSLMSLFELVYFFIIRVIMDTCVKRGRTGST